MCIQSRTTNQEATVNTITDSTGDTSCMDSCTTTRTGSVPHGGTDPSPRTTGGGIGSRTGRSDGNGAVSSSGATGNSPSIAGSGAGSASGGIGGSGSRTGGGIGSVASGENDGKSAAGGSISGCGGDDGGVDTVGGNTCSFEEEDGVPCLIPETAPPRAVWKGHSGPVARIGSCSQPPCFFTLGEVINAFEYFWWVVWRVNSPVVLRFHGCSRRRSKHL